MTRMPYRVSRELTAAGHKIPVVDHLFSADQIASMYGFLETLPYRLNDIDAEETAYSRHWKSELPAEMALRMPVLRQCVDLTHELMAPGRLEMAWRNSFLR